jgi:hypothetical protein
MFMLADKIGGTSGKIIPQRVLANLGGGPKMGNFVPGDWINTGRGRKGDGHVWTIVRPDGTLYGEGQGMMILKNGKMTTWTGHGVGTMKKDGTASYRGAVYYQTASRRWARLNKVAVVFENEVDAEDNTRSDFWEWK